MFGERGTGEGGAGGGGCEQVSYTAGVFRAFTIVKCTVNLQEKEMVEYVYWVYFTQSLLHPPPVQDHPTE